MGGRRVPNDASEFQIEVRHGKPGRHDTIREMPIARRGLPVVLLGNALLRVAGGATGILVGLYLAELANAGTVIGPALAGTLGAMAFGAELVGAIPFGFLSDALAPRGLMTLGAVLAAAATQLFGMTGAISMFFVSRTLEGLGAAATAPSLLAHLTDVTEHDQPLRARIMSYFELSLLAGLALGGLFAGELWRWTGRNSFAAVAILYLVAAGLFHAGATNSEGHGAREATVGLLRALREPSLRRLAPIWLCVNSIIGLWLGPTFSFLATQRSSNGQYLAGLFSDAPHQIGWVMLGYSLVFGAGVTGWSFVLPRMDTVRALRIALWAMFVACGGLYLFNHSAVWAVLDRWLIGVATSLSIMVESGFTPAALSLLATAVGSNAGRGAAMGIYSVLLSLGAILGSLLAGWLAAAFSVDGLIYGTVGMAGAALVLVRRLHEKEAA
jgi:MFS family permease